MCGRFSLTASPDEVKALFDYIEMPNFPARHNIAPTQPIATVCRDSGQRRFRLMRWGLIPSWVKDPSSFTLLINARSETAAAKPSFRASMRHHRCLVPASGFYEWRRTPEGKQPFWIVPADGGIMAMAGLWNTWSDPDGGDMDTAALLTTQANAAISEIHHRMPVIIKPEHFDDWLDTGNVMVKDVMPLMNPIEGDYLTAVPVSDRVNKVANDDADLQVKVAVSEASATSGVSASHNPAKSDQLDLF